MLCESPCQFCSVLAVTTLSLQVLDMGAPTCLISIFFCFKHGNRLRTTSECSSTSLNPTSRVLSVHILLNFLRLDPESVLPCGWKLFTCEDSSLLGILCYWWRLIIHEHILLKTAHLTIILVWIAIEVFPEQRRFRAIYIVVVIKFIVPRGLVSCRAPQTAVWLSIRCYPIVRTVDISSGIGTSRSIVWILQSIVNEILRCEGAHVLCCVLTDAQHVRTIVYDGGDVNKLFHCS